MTPISSATGMNSAGEYQPALRVAPAQQRLAGRDLARRQPHDRLVMHFELARLVCGAQVQLEFAPHADARAHLRLEEAVGALVLHLGLVQGEVGALQKLAGVAAVVGRDGDADAHVRNDDMSLEIVGSVDRGADAAGQRLGVLAVAHILLHDSELVPADARHEIA